MEIAWPKVIPVLVSIGVIIFIALISESSRLVAAIAATFPLTAPLSMWVVFSNAGGQQSALVDYTTGLLVGIVPTLGFLLATWLAARVGWSLWPTLGAGYGAWIIILILILTIRRG
ncbi:MAG: hypothetical protein DWQ07_03315 [Chloroflexi bacterium]|nr:MAG: hypothetical protein DWQ07_03315 [Chloroflexota bacterium]MBL1193470.1 hypothetical protein [Chloroflexota bacterium]NOH10761.1 hypothetical protein [Chloroflexota bacterium]